MHTELPTLQEAKRQYESLDSAKAREIELLLHTAILEAIGNKHKFITEYFQSFVDFQIAKFILNKKGYKYEEKEITGQMDRKSYQLRIFGWAEE